MNIVKKCLVEFFGTMFLMFIILATNNYIAIGSALALNVLVGGNISGGAFNPAVAIGLAESNKIPKQDLIPYIVSEIVGACLAIYLYTFIN